MRLMTGEKGAEQPIDKYVRFKNDISQWYAEMDEAGLTKQEQKYLEPYFLSSYGVPPSQEQLMKMLMDPNLCNFTLAEANTARKIVGKKQTEKIPALKEKVLAQASSPSLGQYIWSCGLGPQMGYSFSVIHALAYSFVGMQTLYLATHFDPVYWDTACLIVNSGALEDAEDSTDYAKIAKALSEVLSNKITVGLPDINKAAAGFEADAENHQILFGLKGISNVGDDVVLSIIRNRPYSSPKDFYNKVKPKKKAMIELIKGGAFDEMMDRKQCMIWFIWYTCDKKSNLTLQNMPTLMKKNLIPDEGELQLSKRIYEFNRYLKAYCLKNKEDTYFILDNRAVNFLCEIEREKLILTDEYSNLVLNQKVWKKIYDLYMDPIRNWIKENKTDILQTLNTQIFLDDWNKYALGNFSSWEMESLSFYFHPHELSKVDYNKYGFSNFFNLSEEPEVDHMLSFKDKEIPIYKLTKICGTCLSRNKNSSTVTLLTREGVVNVKFRKEYFSLFDKRISERGIDGVKHIIEQSWFEKGSMIMVQGIRNGDTFISKKYKNAGMPHQLYKIDKVDETGDIAIRSDRYKGEMEDGD